jgi:uncharacterized membrane protein
MYSRVKIAGHPIHPTLVVFPVAFYTAALVCCLVYSSANYVFGFKVAYIANAAGIVMALLAALSHRVEVDMNLREEN